MVQKYDTDLTRILQKYNIELNGNCVKVQQ
jgi:hypothetical protein